MSDEDNNNNKGNFTDSTIRDQLVNTAVNFLLNPDVQKRHDDNKIEFLRKKGLTEAEIAAAFERADSRNANTFSSPLKTSHPIAAFPPYEPFWSRLSGISSSLIVFGVAIYGLHYFYKKYFKPWFLGVEAEKDSLTENIRMLSDNLSVLTDTVSKLHAIVEKQNEDINKLVQIEGSSYAPTPVILEDLKREVSSLKSILISRHQFPAIPQLQPVKASIPSWQLPTSQNQLMYAESANKVIDFSANTISPNSASYQNGENRISDPILTNRFYFRQQSGEVPESSYGINGTSECLTTGTLDLKTTEVTNLVDPNARFGQSKEASTDGGYEETPATHEVDEA